MLVTGLTGGYEDELCIRIFCNFSEYQKKNLKPKDI